VEGPIADITYVVSGVYFDVVSETGVEYDHPFIVPLEPDLSVTLHPGSSHEGWEGYQVAINDAKPLITFGRNYDGIGSICFKLY
jgi:hypothetical protein